MVLETFLRFLFPDPAVCFLCGGPPGEKTLCPTCAARMPVVQHVPVTHVDAIFALGLYQGSIRKRLHTLKYWDKPHVARRFADAVVEACLLNRSYDVVTAIPMHRRRFIQRGYNQAELLATEIAVRYHFAYRPLLKRVRDTRPQHMLGRFDRLSNVEGAFSVISEVQGLNVLVVDDILTTGSTLSAVAGLLKSSGATRVDALTIAVAPVRGGTVK